MNLNKLRDLIHADSKNKGFWDKLTEIGTRLMLVVTEVAEACEGDRKQIPFGEKGALDEELADIIIRVLDICGGLDINIENVLMKKVAYNKTRPHMYGDVNKY